MPKVSIIIIIYRVERFLEQCLKSVTEQTYENLEIICVVGKGDSACEEICDRTAAGDPRVIVLKKEPQGTAVARNQGLDAASGEYIGFVDGDDYIAPDMIEIMVNAAKKYQADISVVGKFYTYENCIDGTTEDKEYVYHTQQAFETILYQEGFFLHLWDKLYKRELFRSIRFLPGQLVEDRQIACSILLQADRIVYHTASKYYFRVSEDSGSHIEKNLMLSLQADYEICEKLLELYPGLQDAVDFFLVYENMSVIQNSILYGAFSKEHDQEYLSYVATHAKKVKKDPRVPGSIKMKMTLCNISGTLFSIVTRYRRNKFLKNHRLYRTGIDWTATFHEQGMLRSGSRNGKE
ncbi:MAG TPA: glycosyltransferase [Lachnospiraceae bacterium]|nr:glycosyltransferase [Lachnospiraceae bacterium]